MALIILALLFVLFVLLYKFSMAPYGVLSARGIAHEMPKPFIGNLSLRVIFARTPFIQVILDKYKKFKQHKVYGFYNVREPLFVLRDVEVIKKVGIQDFDYFTNHRPMLPESSGTIFSKCLISLNDDKWREMRNTLTPAFTGSKLKAMFELINECSLEGVRYIENELRNANSLDIELEMKDYFERFANDVIASAAFGIKVNSFVDKKNQFYKAGQSVVHFSGLAMIKIILYSIMPRVMKALRVSVFDEKSIDYFKRLVFDAMKYRKEHEIIRPDMIHLLMEAQRQGEAEGAAEKQFSDDDLLAQCLLFFFAGFETVSTCLCFLTYELCKNPEVQSQLHNEILEVQKKLQGKPLDYDTLVHMKYLDMVVSEALRKWPPAPRTDRLCNADIDLKDENNQFVVSLKKGDVLFIPIIALHYDPENFAEPTEFRPERFSDENKQEIKPFTYLPFGVGPRNCIGNRLALMEVKSIVYHLILKFQLEPAEKTVKDMMSSIQGFTMVPKEKFWIKFVARKSNES
ncbi:hypothetical protein KR215_002671 [Drosophila sulfurigaster]|nr:hypothetical protein KR215_002671 [Drosophila sulfurigaster]